MIATGVNDILNEAPSIRQADALNKYAFENRNINPKHASEIAAKALELSTALNYTKGRAESLMSLGFYQIQVADHEKALIYLLEGLALFEQLNDAAGIAGAYYNIGLVNLRLANFNSCIEELHKSLAIREKLNDKSGMAACYFQMSYIHQHFNDLSSAEDVITKCLALREGLNDVSGKAAALMILGELHLKRKQLPEAKEIIYESLRLRETSPEIMGYFATLLRWAEINLEMGDTETALQTAHKGYDMAHSQGIGFGEVRFLQMLGKIEMQRGNLSSAKSYYLDALEYAGKYSFKSILFEVHEAVMEIYKQEGDYKSAFEHFEKFHSIKEEVISLQTNTQLKSVQFVSQLEFARREAEIEKQKNAELNKANQIISEKNKEITDSINYARRIQLALITSEKYIERQLKRLKKQ